MRGQIRHIKLKSTNTLKMLLHSKQVLHLLALRTSLAIFDFIDLQLSSKWLSY
jgi:hypothetical protein